MITKAEILSAAKEQDLRPTIVEKDYVLGWLLLGIARHMLLSKWVFKGGTCLKKCYFETYRFSEDLDFTIPPGEPLDRATIEAGITDVVRDIETETGIEFPADGLGVEEYTNKRGKPSFNAKVTYFGPLRLPRQQQQRVKFDLTRDELLVDEPDRRGIYHPYRDEPDPAPMVLSYSVNEILAEKARALYERRGRARDVYDIVHLIRNYKDVVDAKRAVSALTQKFEFRNLPRPSVEIILDRVDKDVLRANWEQQLAHQLPGLPPVETFFLELREALAWWMEPAYVGQPLPRIPMKPAERPVARPRFPAIGRVSPLGLGDRVRGTAAGATYSQSALNKIRYAARNYLCARLRYRGVHRVAEPYSLRYARTGNTLLYVFEVRRGDVESSGIKAFEVDEIESVTVTDRPFVPRYLVEL
jgi:predicted nucleotidyltransferase component of viral defense system